MQRRHVLALAVLLVGLHSACQAAGWRNMLKDHDDFMREVEPIAPRVKRMADTYLAEQGFHPGQLTAAVWLDGGDWKVDYWHTVPQEGYLYDHPNPNDKEHGSLLIVHIAKGWHLRHEVRAPIPMDPPPPNKYIAHAQDVLRQRGYDPEHYEPRLWYFGEWRVDYWRKGVQPADFLVPPALVVHLAYPKYADRQEDVLEIPIDPRTVKSQQKR